jgi:hypothetical protein
MYNSRNDSNKKRTRIFVGGLSNDMDEEERKSYLTDLFSDFDVQENHIQIISERETGVLRAFCFVDIDPSEVDRLLESGLDEKSGLTINKAREREDKPGFKSNNGGGFRGGNGGGFRGGNNNYRKSY